MENRIPKKPRRFCPRRNFQKAISLLNKDDLIKQFNDNISFIQSDRANAEDAILAEIEELKVDGVKSRAVMRACFSVFLADGDRDITEKEIFSRICKVLEIDAKEFNL